MQKYLKIIADGGPLSRADMREAMDVLLGGKASDIEIAAFLMGLRGRGETVDELVGAAEAMRSAATPVDAGADLVDTCGTGGDGQHTYNISTAAAIVAAGAGVKIAKHGNRAASSSSGSSDVLSVLGVNLQATPDTVRKAIEVAGIGFMFAANHHKAVAKVAPVRKALGVRTIFNLLGPLSNPAGASRQLLGVFDGALVSPIAEALGELGTKRAWIVHGDDGLDELTTTTTSRVADLNGTSVQSRVVSPEEAGLPRCEPRQLRGGSPEENARALKDLLTGQPGAYRDIVLLNAAATLVVADLAPDLTEGAALAAQSIDSGRAVTALSELIRITNE
ncbi:MAG: anthranilate phosphoribosyltransferase [Pseudomonadota bacterium]